MDETAEYDAATANQLFIALIVARLVARGVLSTLDVLDAIDGERRVIEDLRRLGGDPRLLARASDALASSIGDALAGHGLSALQFSRWSLDPKDPCWPMLPDNDP
jgi:hypothetical protein